VPGQETVTLQWMGEFWAGVLTLHLSNLEEPLIFVVAPSYVTVDNFLKASCLSLITFLIWLLQYLIPFSPCHFLLWPKLPSVLNFNVCWRFICSSFVLSFTGGVWTGLVRWYWYSHYCINTVSLILTNYRSTS